MKITKIRHSWPEIANFVLNRPRGSDEYIFLHFWTPMQILIDGQIITTKPHACIIFNTGTPQYFTAPEIFTHDWMHITGSVAKYIEYFNLKFDTIYYPKNYDFITELIRELEQEFTSHSEYYLDIENFKIKELFAKLSRAVNENETRIPLNAKTIELLKTLRLNLCTNYSEQWTIESMAKFIGLSPSYLYASYKMYYKISPIKDLISIRIERSKSLLSSTNITTQDIAKALGYANTTHFIRQFTKNVGVPPSSYRKQHELTTRMNLEHHKLISDE